MAEDPKHVEDGGVRRLDYRDGGADRVPVRKAQVVGGIVASVVIILGAVFIGILASLDAQRSEPALYVIGSAVVGCNIAAFFAYRSARCRWLGVGLWIGFGVAALIEGACFGIMRS
jgi:hypothetical protein